VQLRPVAVERDPIVAAGQRRQRQGRFPVPLGGNFGNRFTGMDRAVPVVPDRPADRKSVRLVGIVPKAQGTMGPGQLFRREELVRAVEGRAEFQRFRPVGSRRLSGFQLHRVDPEMAAGHSGIEPDEREMVVQPLEVVRLESQGITLPLRRDVEGFVDSVVEEFPRFQMRLHARNIRLHPGGEGVGGVRIELHRKKPNQVEAVAALFGASVLRGQPEAVFPLMSDV